MATTHVTSAQRRSTAPALTGQPGSSVRYDWIAALLGTFSTAGGYLDLWAHTHVPQLETFFTPWHGVLYGSFLLFSAFLLGTMIINHRKGYSWLRSMPQGYEFAVLGVFIFVLGGLGDMCWHILFGIEKSVDALLSPTHLVIGLGSFFLKTGPLRAAWKRGQEQSLRGWRDLGPMLFSLLAILTSFVFFSWYASPFAIPIAAAKGATNDQTLLQSFGVASIFLQTALLMAPILLIVRRWQLPFGALTLIFALTHLAVSVPQDTYYLLPVALLSGLAADILLKLLRPSEDSGNGFRLFAFTVPLVLYLLYFLELQLTTGIAWTIHMWMGSTVLSGSISLLISYLLIPPQGATA